MVKKFIQVAKDLQPDAILSIGDLIDFRSVSRWSAGTAMAYAPVLQDDIDATVSQVLRPLREAAPNAAITWLAGNHCERLDFYIQQYAWQAKALRAMEMRNLFSMDELDVNYVKGPERIGTNVYAIHGHEAGGYAATPSAWDTKFTKRYGSDKSFVFGHTHQPYIIHRATGFKGKVSPRFTMNVGSLMDPVQATYVGDGAVNWTMSFGLIRDDGKRVWPELITATDRGFWFNGNKY
jgi:predicted MPP superfamily phosphohydrolase